MSFFARDAVRKQTYGAAIDTHACHLCNSAAYKPCPATDSTRSAPSLREAGGLIGEANFSSENIPDDLEWDDVDWCDDHLEGVGTGSEDGHGISKSFDDVNSPEANSEEEDYGDTGHNRNLKASTGDGRRSRICTGPSGSGSSGYGSDRDVEECGDEEVSRGGREPLGGGSPADWARLAASLVNVKEQLAKTACQSMLIGWTCAQVAGTLAQPSTQRAKSKLQTDFLPKKVIVRDKNADISSSKAQPKLPSRCPVPKKVMLKETSAPDAQSKHQKSVPRSSLSVPILPPPPEVIRTLRQKVANSVLMLLRGHERGNSEEWNERLPQLALRLEGLLFRDSTSMVRRLCRF